MHELIESNETLTLRLFEVCDISMVEELRETLMKAGEKTSLGKTRRSTELNINRQKEVI